MTEFLKISDFSAIISQAKEKPRSYEVKAPSASIYKPDNARFKLVVWFKDGNKRYFYSYDNKHYKDKVITDEYESLLKLLRLVNNYKDLYKNAILYTCLDPGKSVNSNFCYEVIKFDMYGNKKTNKAINFINQEKNIFLDLERLKNNGNARIL